jgi:ABC-type multidrug transport system fused ATPase/permease subunit
MKLKFKNSFIGYFQFYYSVLGNKLLFNMGLGIAVGFLDGLGLTLFLPLIQTVGDGKAPANTKGMGSLHFMADMITGLGLPLVIGNILIMLVLLFIIKGFLKFVQLNSQVILCRLFMRRIRYSLLDDLQGLTYKGFLELDAGKIQNTLTTEVQRLSSTVKLYFNAAQAAVMMLTYVLLAFLANYQFAILVAVGAALSNLLYRKIYRSTKTSSVDISIKGNEFNGLLIQAVHYFKYLKSTNYFGRFSVHLRKVIEETEYLSKKMGFNSAITTSVKEPMIIIIVAGVIYLQVNVMHASITPIMVTLLFLYRALNYLVVVQNFWQTFVQNIGAMHAVAVISKEMGGMQEKNKPEKVADFNKAIHINDVSFAYGENKVLNNIDIVIPKNKTVAFVGESGSGKTTLANMIAGLIEPNQGSIDLDELMLNQNYLNNYRSKIGYISQEAAIFSDSIFNNITFWEEPTPQNIKRFWEIIELASLTSYVQGLPEKENTKLGDNGVLISGGQKQRISIARELYKNAEILILDEATSALDSETEKVIQENIEKLHGSYTMVIIAHRLSTIKNADCIYLLDKGNVSASGNFDTILKNSERFKRMVSLQEI